MRSTAANAMILAAAFAACNLSAQETPGTAPQDKSIHLQHVSQPARLADFAFGRDVPGYVRITDFRQNYPSDGKPVSRETSAWLAWDDQNLFAVFLCREDKGKVRARLARREDINSDDQVGIYLDTFHDRQRVFSFYVNPLGIQADSIGA